MILENDGWPCFAGRSCGRGRPQPQCGRASVRIWGGSAQKSDIFVPTRGLQRGIVLPSVYSPYATRQDTGWGRGSLGRASRRGLDARRRVNKMIPKDDGWPCFAGRSCGRGHPQPQCRRARYVSGAWLLQRSETVAPTRGLQRGMDFWAYVSGAWLLQRLLTVLRRSLVRTRTSTTPVWMGSVRVGALVLQRSETVVPMRGLQREVDFGTYVYCRHGSNDAGRNLRQNVFFILFHLSAMILITATMSLISTFLSVLTSAVVR